MDKSREIVSFQGRLQPGTQHGGLMRNRIPVVLVPQEHVIRLLNIIVPEISSLNGSAKDE
jgi:hypothetical protein